jgi:hypothetical protein
MAFQESNGSSYRGRGAGRGRGRGGRGRPYGRGRGGYGGGRSESNVPTTANNDNELADLRKLVLTMGENLEGLARRLEGLTNRGPDKNPERSNSDQPKSAGPRTTTTPTLVSDNDDFACVSKSIYRMVQLQHHQDNWKSLPKALDQRLRRLAADIKPPMADDDLRSEIVAATIQFGEQLGQIVRTHLAKKRGETETTAATLNSADLDRAKEVATKYVGNRLGRRMPEARRLELVDAAAKKIGGRRRPYLVTGPDGFQTLVRDPPASPKTFSSVVTAGPSRKRPLLPSPKSTDSPLKRGNRFSVLAEVHAVAEAEAAVLIDLEPDDDPTPAVVPSPPSSPPHERGRRHLVADGSRKDDWKLQLLPSTKTIVIGDSNLRLVDEKDVPDDWQVYCFPGAKFHNVARLVNTTALKGKNVVVQVGINHRDQQQEQFQDNAELVHERIVGMGAHPVFVGVSIPNSITGAQQLHLGELNYVMAALYGKKNYVPSLPPAETQVSMNDSFGIHYTAPTVARIFDKIRSHLNS